ncbi:Uncharacterized protein FWK35_00031782, partial [Aphis craccivora]
MYKCDMCPAVFNMKWNLARHVNTHNGIRYSCTVCEKKYTDNSNLNKHMKNVHAIFHAPPAQIVQPVTLIDSVIKFTPRIIRPALPDVLTGGSNMSDDEICMAAMDNFENEQEVQQRYIEIAPEIFVPDIQASASNMMSDDEICMATMENYEKEMQDDNTDCLAENVDKKRAIINPQNLDQQCFKWAILARHVTGPVACRVGDNYRQHE